FLFIFLPFLPHCPRPPRPLRSFPTRPLFRSSHRTAVALSGVATLDAALLPSPIRQRLRQQEHPVEEAAPLVLHRGDCLGLVSCASGKEAERAQGDDHGGTTRRSEEHKTELQSRFEVVCHLLREKTKGKIEEA